MNEFNVTKNYNWQTGSELLVKKYVADLYQTGANPPVATELFNNTGVAFTYQYINPGVYAVVATKDIFTAPTAQKTQVNITNATYIDSLVGPNGQSCIAFPVAPFAMIILSSDLTAEVDNILGNNSQNALEITIYP